MYLQILVTSAEAQPSIIHINVEPNYTILQVKEIISSILNMRIENQLLELNHEVLDDLKTLAECNVQVGTTLVLLSNTPNTNNNNNSNANSDNIRNILNFQFSSLSSSLYGCSAVKFKKRQTRICHKKFRAKSAAKAAIKNHVVLWKERI